MEHNFEKSLQRERNKADEADEFYRNVFHATDIVRYSSDSDADMDFQRKDIDVAIEVENRTFYISEKFREVDYGDLYIEVYSKYPHKQGWMHTGSPDVLVYFTPAAVYRIAHRSLREFCIEKLFPQIPEKWFLEICRSGKTIMSKKLVLNKKLVSLNIIQAHNKSTDGAVWETIGLSIPFDVLEENGVRVKKYSR